MDLHFNMQLLIYIPVNNHMLIDPSNLFVLHISKNSTMV